MRLSCYNGSFANSASEYFSIKNKEGLLKAMGSAFGSKGIDSLIIESHGYTPRITWDNPDRSIDLTKDDASYFNWGPVKAMHGTYIKMNKSANIGLRGCQIGDRDGNGFGQHWANKTGATVWAAKNGDNTAQVTLHGGGAWYQMTDTAIVAGMLAGTIYKDSAGAFFTYSKPTSTGYVKYTK